jgi:hypothetical protein
MKALKHPLMWIVICMLLSIRIEAQTEHYLVGYQTSFNGSDAVSYVSNNTCATFESYLLWSILLL